MAMSLGIPDSHSQSEDSDQEEEEGDACVVDTIAQTILACERVREWTDDRLQLLYACWVGRYWRRSKAGPYYLTRKAAAVMTARVRDGAADTYDPYDYLDYFSLPGTLHLSLRPFLFPVDLGAPTKEMELFMSTLGFSYAGTHD